MNLALPEWVKNKKSKVLKLKKSAMDITCTSENPGGQGKEKVSQSHRRADLCRHP